MMEKLYGEISADNSHRLAKHILGCEACFREWKDVQYCHDMMSSLADDPLPPHLEQSVLRAARTEAAYPPQSARRYWKPLAAAAAVLAILGGSYSYYSSNQPGFIGERLTITDSRFPDSDKIDLGTTRFAVPPDSDSVSVEKVSRTVRGIEPRLEIKKALPQNTETLEIALAKPTKTDPIVEHISEDQSVGAYGFKPKDEKAAVILTANTTREDENVVEELFRTGLTLYNKAFTKIGEDRRTILKSAIIFFRDFETQHPSMHRWIAYGKFLIADSYRELGEIDAAIANYRQVIRDYADLESCGKHARLSIVKLLLDETTEYQQVENELQEFESLYPSSPEFARFALTFADKIGKTSPEKSVIWCREVMTQWPEIHPTWQKAQQLAGEMQKHLIDKQKIRDWLLIGPLNREAMLDELPSEPSDQWRRPKVAENGEVNVMEALDASSETSCAYAVTHIYSPKSQSVVLTCEGTDGLRIWVNDDPILGVTFPGQYHRNAIDIYLKEGWNKLAMKTYHSESDDWRFSVRLIDHNGLVIPDLRIAADMKNVESQ
jgi:tetratricopeptide (TPR) repeat protein